MPLMFPPPSGYRKLSPGERCRECFHEWTDGIGGYWCCQHVAISAPTYAPDVEPNRTGCSPVGVEQWRPDKANLSSTEERLLAQLKMNHAEHMQRLSEIVELLKDISQGLA